MTPEFIDALDRLGRLVADAMTEPRDGSVRPLPPEQWALRLGAAVGDVAAETAPRGSVARSLFQMVQAGEHCRAVQITKGG